MILRLLGRLHARFHCWLVARLRREHTVRGFRVVIDNHRADIDSEAVLRRFEEALDLIERYQPARFAHMRRDVQLFWIVRQPTRGSYWPGHGMIVTELTFLARTDIGPHEVASSILHEGVHARIDRMRLQEKSRNRGREERICRRAELALCRAFPPDVGSHLVARFEAMVALSDEELDISIDWTEAHRRQAEVDRAAFKAWIRGAA